MAAFMEKWHMNSGNLAHSYQQNFQEVLMGQASKGFSTKSTGGMLGWRGEWLYKEVITMKKGGNQKREKQKKKNKVYSYKLELNIRIHHPRTWPRRFIFIFNSSLYEYTLSLILLSWVLSTLVHFSCKIVPWIDPFSYKYIVLG